MNKCDCIVADDEKLARDVMQNYIARIEYLNLIAACHDGLEVNNLLRKKSAEILFLDIRMPHISGLSLIKALPNPPKVILTTAYREHAIEAFELNVVDYLLKPFSFERFLQAVNKAIQQNASIDATQGKCIHIKVEREMVVVPVKDIVYIEAAGNYTKLHLESLTLITYSSLNDVSSLLPQKRFQQIHRSYLVNVDKILKYNRTTIALKGIDLPVGRNYRAQVTLFLTSKL